MSWPLLRFTSPGQLWSLISKLQTKAAPANTTTTSSPHDQARSETTCTVRMHGRYVPQRVRGAILPPSSPSPVWCRTAPARRVAEYNDASRPGASTTLCGLGGQTRRTRPGPVSPPPPLVETQATRMISAQKTGRPARMAAGEKESEKREGGGEDRRESNDEVSRVLTRTWPVSKLYT
ncbi:unnamed protein product [Diplocarpon coronariae]